MFYSGWDKLWTSQDQSCKTPIPTQDLQPVVHFQVFTLQSTTRKTKGRSLLTLISLGKSAVVTRSRCSCLGTASLSITIKQVRWRHCGTAFFATHYLAHSIELRWQLLLSRLMMRPDLSSTSVRQSGSLRTSLLRVPRPRAKDMLKDIQTPGSEKSVHMCKCC